MTISREDFERIKADPQYFFETFLYIENKDGLLVKFILKPAQILILNQILELEEQGLPVRIIILKGRQLGCSTLISAYMFWKTITRSHRRSVIVSHENKSAQFLLNMITVFYDEMPEWKPLRRISNRNELWLSNPDKSAKKGNKGLRSRIIIFTADSKQASRAFNFQYAHCSEIGFWQNASGVMLSLSQGVPRKADTMIILESTANSTGNYFERTYLAAKAGDNDYKPLFLCWMLEPEYRMPVPDGFEPTERERKLIKLYDMDMEQVVWMRHTIATECEGSEEAFQQEYPFNDEEAFIAQGRKFFPPDVITEAKLYIKDKNIIPLIGALWEDEHENIEFIENPERELKIFNVPEKKREYVIGVDAAEGVTGGTYSVAQVLDMESWQHMAVWRSRIRPVEFANVVRLLGYYFNEALLAVERNNHGLVVISELQDEYFNFYRQRDFEHREKVKEEIGWWTSDKSKNLMLNKLLKALRSKDLIILDEVTVDELNRVIVTETGITVSEGSYDDTVMALAVAVMACLQYAIPDFAEEEASMPDGGMRKSRYLH